VQILDFVEHHRPALEREEVRHDVILANLGRLALEHPPSCSGRRSALLMRVPHRRPDIRSCWASSRPRSAAHRRKRRATSIIPVSSVPTERRNGLLNAPSVEPAMLCDFCGTEPERRWYSKGHKRASRCAKPGAAQRRYLWYRDRGRDAAAVDRCGGRHRQNQGRWRTGWRV